MRKRWVISLMFLLIALVVHQSVAAQRLPARLSYVSPECPQSNLSRLKRDMGYSLSSAGFPITFQPVAHLVNLKDPLREPPPASLSVPEWDPKRNGARLKLHPLLKPVRRGNAFYHKVLLGATRSDLCLIQKDHPTVAMTSMGPNAMAILNAVLFTPHGISGAKISAIIVPKDKDALFALAMGQVDMALVVKHDMDRIAKIYPNILKRVHPLLESAPIAMPVLCYSKGGTTHASTPNAPRPIAIVLSDTQAAYTQPVASFTNEIQMPVKVFNLKGKLDNAPAIMAKIHAIRPALIFALGAKAACTAKVWTADRPHTPVIFAMVLNWRQYRLTEGQANMAGIATEVAPGTQLINMALISPRIKKVGIIYSKSHSLETLRQIKAAAKKLGLKIIALPISRPKEFRQAYKKIADRIDAFWMLSDPEIYTINNVDWLKQRCTMDSLVCMGQSKNIAEAGILLAVTPDQVNVGRQAASMAKSILLAHRLAKQIGVMPPLGTQLILNAKTAADIGLTLSRPVVDMASTIIDR